MKGAKRERISAKGEHLGGTRSLIKGDARKGSWT